MAWSQLEAMERDARYALFYEKSTSQNRSPRISKTGKRYRQEMPSIEPSESYEVLMMQEIQGVQNRCGAQMEEKEEKWHKQLDLKQEKLHVVKQAT